MVSKKVPDQELGNGPKIVGLKRRAPKHDLVTKQVQRMECLIFKIAEGGAGTSVGEKQCRSAKALAVESLEMLRDRKLSSEEKLKLGCAVGRFAVCLAGLSERLTSAVLELNEEEGQEEEAQRENQEEDDETKAEAASKKLA